MLFSCHQPEIWFLEKLSSLINASTNMNSSLSKISQYCHNYLKSLISGLRHYLIWSGWAELAAADPRKVGSHLSVGEQVGGVWVGQSISIRVGHSDFSYSDVSNQIPEKFEWSKWVQFWKTRYIRIFNVLHRDCLYFYHELQLSLIMVTSNQYFCLGEHHTCTKWWSLSV